MYRITLPAGKGLSLLQYIPRGRRSVEPIHLIPDLCSLTGDNERMKSDGRLMQSLANSTRFPPSKRAANTRQLLRDVLAHEAVQKTLKAYPLSISDTATDIKARVLGPFTLTAAGSPNLQLSEENRRSFQAEARRFGFYPPPTSGRQTPTSAAKHQLGAWSLLHCVGEEKAAETVQRREDAQRQPPCAGGAVVGGSGAARVDGLKGKIQEADANKSSFLAFIAPGGDAKSAHPAPHTALSRVATSPQCWACVSSLPRLCSVFKGECVTKYGLTSLVDPKRLMAVLGNILAQVMAKLNYGLWRLDLSSLFPSSLRGAAGCMMVGIDVCHNRRPPRCSQAHRGRRLQAPRSAILRTLHRLQWDGQVPRVPLRGEGALPLPNRRDGHRLDHHQPVLSDFFLVPSIVPPLACARPTRFVVLRDDLKMSANALQALSNALCSLYHNWQGSIRVPHVTMLAHKLAFLCGRYVRGAVHAKLNDKPFYL